jgi:hypothetical protein
MSRVERHFVFVWPFFCFLPLTHRRDFPGAMRRRSPLPWNHPQSASYCLQYTINNILILIWRAGIGEKVTSCELFVSLGIDWDCYGRPILGIEYQLQRIRYRHNNILSEVQRTSGFEPIVSGSYKIMSLASIE